MNTQTSSKTPSSPGFLLPNPMAQEKGPVFPDWTRMPSHYATFQEFQRDKNLADWRLEEALIRLVGQGHGMNFKAD